MNTGERLQTARKLRGMTQIELGEALGYRYKNAEARIGQYESAFRRPKEPMIKQMAEVLRVNPKAISGPTGYGADDVMQILFDLEAEGYDIEICRCKDEIVVKIKHPALNKPLEEWKMMKTKRRLEKISEKEYLTWKFEWVLTM